MEYVACIFVVVRALFRASTPSQWRQTRDLRCGLNVLDAKTRLESRLEPFRPRGHEPLHHGEHAVLTQCYPVLTLR